MNKKAFRVEIVVVDHENYGLECFKDNLRNMEFYIPKITKSEEADIGEWSDEHPLNYRNVSKEVVDGYFKSDSL